MSTDTVPTSNDKAALMVLALAKLRDIVDAFDTLSGVQRREALKATAAYLDDLRAAGVYR